MAAVATQQVRDPEFLRRASRTPPRAWPTGSRALQSYGLQLTVDAWECDCCMPGVSAQQAAHAAACMAHGVACMEDLRGRGMWERGYSMCHGLARFESPLWAEAWPTATYCPFICLDL